VIKSSIIALLSLLAPAIAGAQSTDTNVVWTTPGKSSADSMPLGNGSLGINLWVEANGDLLFYLSRNDAYSEISQLCKAGQVRVSLSPTPFAVGAPFRQELKLREGICEITAGPPDKRVTLKVFVDAEAPVVHVIGESQVPLTVSAKVESWRTEPQPVASESAWTLASGPPNIVQAADKFPSVGPDAIAWFHRNENAFAFEETVRLQSLETIRETLWNPLLNRTFGGWIAGKGFQATDARTLATAKPLRSFHLRVASPCEQTATADDWLKFARETAAKSADPAEAVERTARWWAAFQDRSWVHCDVPPGGEVPKNDHPVRIGVDSGGGNRFAGSTGGLHLLGEPLAPNAIAARAKAPAETNPIPAAAPLDFKQGLTIEGWIKPDAAASGRILDKVTAGKPDGFLFDVQGENGLRLIVGTTQLQSPKQVLKPGQWQHVAATYDARDGAMAISVDGAPVAHVDSTLSPTGRTRHGLFVGQDKVSPEVAAMTLGKAWTLQRYMQACAGRSILPIKFNGSIFTIEPNPLPAAATHNSNNGLKTKDNPDWRRWGDCHWWQNVRMPYHAMQAAGDFDLMLPLFDMYERIRPFAEARAKLYHNVEGCYFSETLTIWGAYANGDYGWDRKGKQPKDVATQYWRYAWNQGLELVGLMLDYYEHTGDNGFATKRLFPMATSVLKYFDSRFSKDADGRIVLDPTQAVETYWHGVINDTPSVAGLNDISARLCALPETLTTPEQRKFFAHMKAAAPVLPIEDAQLGGKTVRRIAVAQKYEPKRSNCENPELFPIWPFRLFGLERPMLEEARNAYQLRGSYNDVGWGYDSNAAALLGLTREAAEIVKSRMANANAAYRWPATWGPNFDWLPDQCHGGNLMATINYMLLQSAGDRILLFPAWPKDWDVSFKLHAPKQTTVEATVKNGMITALKVIPESRRKDIVINPEFATK